MFDRPAGTGCILQPREPFVGKTAAPLTDRHFRHLQFARDLLIGLAGSGRQNNPASLHHTLRSGWRSHQLIQRCFHSQVERNSGGNSRHVPTVADNRNTIKNYLDDVLVTRENGEQEDGKPLALDQFPDNGNPDFDTALDEDRYRSRLRAVLGREPELLEVVEAVLDLNLCKPEAIADVLNTTASEIQNRKKKLRRRLVKHGIVKARAAI